MNATIASPSSAARPVRALVIGAGPAAVAMHFPVLRTLRTRGEVELKLVCDIDPMRTQAARRLFGFEDESGDALAAIERRDIDAVYIFGSAQMHYEYGLAALRQGKHVFVEKPIAPSYLQACELAHTAATHGVIAAGGHNRRFYASLASVRARAGKSRWPFAEAMFHKPELGKAPPFGARSWLSANGIHALDALLYMMGGPPDRLTSAATAAGTVTPSAFSALLQWADESQGIFLCNNNAGARREEYTFHGLGETCRITEHEVTVEKNGRIERAALASTGDGVVAEHEAFLQAVRSASEPPHAIAALAPSLFVCEQIEQGFSGRIQLPERTPAKPPAPRAAISKTILVAQPTHLQSALARLLPHYRIVTLEEIRASTAERGDVVAALLGLGATPIDAQTLRKLPNLAIVGIAALSVARYEAAALLERGVAVVNASEAYAESVAELALGLAILGRRRAFISHELMRNGGWGTRIPDNSVRAVVGRSARKLRPALRSLGLEPLLLRAWKATERGGGSATSGLDAGMLRGATVGLIGWSANAQAFAKRLTREGARVAVYSEHATGDEIERAGAKRASLATALAADVVSLHRGLTPATRHFLGKSELAKLRPGAVLINIARGALIEPNALIERLRAGDVIACLDTFETEPPARSDPLRSLPNVFLTSHIAGGSKDMLAAAGAEVVAKVSRHLAGDVPESVSIERLQTMT